MKKVFLSTFVLTFVLLTSAQNVLQYVNPLIGTDQHGHTYPGAVYPFGMVQLSPDTRKDGWDGCSGYHYSDDVIYGFSHTHLSGTGVSDYADVLLKPFSTVSLFKKQNFTDDRQFASKFSHNNETASPGYYSVMLDPDSILAELTATARCGVHRYTFMNEKDYPMFFLDLTWRDIVLDSYLEQNDKYEITGYRHSSAWAADQRLFFVMQFSEPIEEFVIMENEQISDKKSVRGKNIKALIKFSSEQKQITVKVGISATGIEGARKNLIEETGKLNFDQIKALAEQQWKKELSKIAIEDKDQNKKTVFYTSLYHCMIVPNIYNDVDGKYLGRDFQIHETTDFDYYTVFSLWDTYRAYHPLMTIIDTKRTTDFVMTMLHQYEEGGLLPVWEFASNETWCMIGYHSVPVIADAILKNIGNIDKELALKAMIKSATRDHFGLEFYKKYGYIPADMESESISKTLEYAYDDWCIAMIAKQMGEMNIYKSYIKRAQFYKNIFDTETGFFRPKMNGNKIVPFDPREVNFHFTEANAWQYSMYVPHDVDGFKTLLGGDDALCKKLDKLFTTDNKTTGRTQVDITGLIGQYAQGNEPSQHMAYLYSYCGKPYKTQEMTNRIMNEFYTHLPDGLCGNEDCGQMSAWYVLSSLGFYPVNPADGIFVFGSPQFEKAVLNLENGKKFILRTENRTDANFYIDKITLNGKPYTKTYVTYNDIMNGGEIVFKMSSKPNILAGNIIADRPPSQIQDYLLTPSPTFISEGRTFKNNTKVTIYPTHKSHQVFFTTDGTDPDQTSQKYSNALTVNETTTFKAISYDQQTGKSFVTECKVQKIPEGRSVKINSEYNPQYSAGGDEGIIDYLRGPADFRTGYWQGYQNEDFEAIVDLGRAETVSYVALGCLQDARPWIWMPVFVEFSSSDDGKNWKPLGKVENHVKDTDMEVQIFDFALKLAPFKTRYIKVFAKNYGTIPTWHPGSGGEAFIFVDEIIVE
ncbi:MAG: GH92 family glycosyl hydrolase [Bacteroidales bacterium]|nr:GH92 family glycosyl hydrolase [Bacteroidales bacterium]